MQQSEKYLTVDGYAAHAELMGGHTQSGSDIWLWYTITESDTPVAMYLTGSAQLKGLEIWENLPTATTLENLLQLGFIEEVIDYED